MHGQVNRRAGQACWQGTFHRPVLGRRARRAAVTSGGSYMPPVSSTASTGLKNQMQPQPTCASMISRLCSMSRTAASCWLCCHRTSARWYMLLEVSLHGDGRGRRVGCQGVGTVEVACTWRWVCWCTHFRWLSSPVSPVGNAPASSRPPAFTPSPQLALCGASSPVPRAQHLQLHLQCLLIALCCLLQLALQITEAG